MKMSLRSTRASTTRHPGLLLLRPSLFTGQTQLLRSFRVDSRITILPIFVITPTEGGLYRRSRQSRTLEQIQGMANQRQLHLGIFRLSAGIAKGKVAEDKSWNTAFLDDVPCRTDNHRWNTALLKRSRDQTHGLVTNRSERNQQGDVGTVVDTSRHDLRRILFDRSSLAVVGGHAMKSRGDRFNSPFLL